MNTAKYILAKHTILQIDGGVKRIIDSSIRSYKSLKLATNKIYPQQILTQVLTKASLKINHCIRKPQQTATDYSINNSDMVVAQSPLMATSISKPNNMGRRDFLKFQLFGSAMVGLSAYSGFQTHSPHSIWDKQERQEEIEQLKNCGKTNTDNLERFLLLEKIFQTVMALVKIIGFALLAIAIGFPFDFSWFEAGYNLI